jgi:hypothetical protein
MTACNSEERKQRTNLCYRVPHAGPNLKRSTPVAVADINPCTVHQQTGSDSHVAAKGRFVKRGSAARTTRTRVRLCVCKSRPAGNRNPVKRCDDRLEVSALGSSVQHRVTQHVGCHNLPAVRRIKLGYSVKRVTWWRLTTDRAPAPTEPPISTRQRHRIYDCRAPEPRHVNPVHVQSYPRASGSGAWKSSTGGPQVGPVPAEGPRLAERPSVRHSAPSEVPRTISCR